MLVPRRLNVLSTIDCISLADRGSHCALQVEVRITVIKLFGMSMESKLQKFRVTIASFATRHGPITCQSWLVATELRGPSSHMQCHSKAPT